jgi:PAS domain S-box-containing protein
MASFENEYRRRDGTTFIGELKLQTMRSAENQNTYIFGYVEDITQRKQAEIEIRERTEELELINALNEAVNRGDNLNKVMDLFSRELRKIGIYKDSTIYLLNQDGKTLVMQHLGISPSLLKKIEKLTSKALPHITIPIAESGSFQKVLQTGQGFILTDPKIIQNRILEFIGASPLPAALRSTIRKLIPQIYSLLDIHSSLVVPLVSDKQVIGLLDVSSSELMTEKDLHRIQKISGQLTAVIVQEWANEALLESEERYRSIFDGVQDAIFVETKDGRILGVNHRACEMYGYSRDEFLRKTVNDLVPDGNLIFPQTDVQINISHTPLETINRRANGDVFPAEVSGGMQTINGEEMLLVIVRDITERKQTEEALNESRKIFHLLIESLPQNIYAKDVDGRFIFANQNYCTTQGKTLQQILDKTDFDLHPTELAEKYFLDDQRVIKTGKTIELEEEHQPVGGRKSYVQVIKTPFYYAKGQPAGILGIFWDITERRQTEEGIRQRVRALELLYESGLAFSHLLNPKDIAQKIIELLGEKLDWHHTAIRLVGAQDDSLELVAFDQRGMENATNDLITEAHISKLITKFGEGISGWALEQSKIIRSGDVSNDPHYLASFPDIHSGLYVPLKSGERKLGVISIESDRPNAFSEADEQLISTLANQAAIAFENARLYEEINQYTEELEQRVIKRTAEIEFTRKRLDLAVKAGGIGIWEVNLKENKLFWDKRMHDIYDTDPAEFNNSLDTWWENIHVEDLEQTQTRFADALQKTGIFSDEHRIVRSDGSLRYTSVDGLVLSDAEYTPERVIGVNVDITMHKQAEEALRLANAEMERALRIKNEFLSTMSHELRTPLNAILGISESLEEQISGKLNEKQIKYVHTINESGRHLLELINDILDLSKIEAGKLEIEPQPISVEKLCSSSLRMIKELALKKSLSISFKLDENVKMILGDERRLKQSLVNLLGNAVKFTPQGKKIGLEVNGSAKTNEVTFTVWDEGIGITEEDIQRLFKPFVQVNASLTREYSGTGLGLALVAQMVRLHGGQIKLTSELKVGSRFTVTLPWLPTEQERQLPLNLLPQANNSKTSEKRTGKILVVDDTEDVTQLIKEYLEHKGYEVFIAHDGRQAVLLAKQERPQLILMDIMMPELNGIEATKQIRADASLNRVLIIGLTALAMPKDREECLAAGMNGYLSKPIEMYALSQVVEDYLTPTDQSQTG